MKDLRDHQRVNDINSRLRVERVDRTIVLYEIITTLLPALG